ncbi:DMT family transporter [Alkalibacter mobilis]|uniref:DMT family transporter n=1 Tax=Alkalibacter mobilis TaxID=2787712 RepID=UPI00189C62B9|nr:DMT family transporter [Alkalibacter mobilis]MBF7097146.1 DMT family transporter [Alkalibacter mobilis]
MNIKNLFTKKTNVFILAVFCTLLWGSAFPAVKIGYELFEISQSDIFGKIAFAGYRFTLSGIMVMIFDFLINKKLSTPSKKELPKIFVLGLLLTSINYTLFYVGLANTTGVNGAILNSTGTFFSVILAHFFFRDDKLTFLKFVGVGIGFSGVALVNLTDSMISTSFNFLGDGFIIISALIGSIGFIYSKKLSSNMSTVTLTGFQLFFGGLTMMIIAWLNGSYLTGFSPRASLLLVYLAFLTASAFTIWTTLFKYNNVSRITIYKFLIPIFGAVLSALFLKEKLFSWVNLTALFLVSIGIYVVNSVKPIKNKNAGA